MGKNYNVFELFYPPSQKATVLTRECGAGIRRSRVVAKAAMARRQLGEGGYASAGYAEVTWGPRLPGLRSQGYFGGVG